MVFSGSADGLVRTRFASNRLSNQSLDRWNCVTFQMANSLWCRTVGDAKLHTPNPEVTGTNCELDAL